VAYCSSLYAVVWVYLGRPGVSRGLRCRACCAPYSYAPGWQATTAPDGRLRLQALLAVGADLACRGTYGVALARCVGLLLIYSVGLLFVALLWQVKLAHNLLASGIVLTVLI